MYISIHPYFDENITVLKYSQTEMVKDIRNIEHKIINNVLNRYGIKGVEITSTADIPAGTGLGSSSSFTVGLLHTVNAYRGKLSSKADLAKLACHIEINELGAPIGKQDQYAAAIGGLNFIRFNANDTVTVEPILIGRSLCKRLEDNLLMFYTGEVRNANDILHEQRSGMSDKEKTSNLLKM